MIILIDGYNLLRSMFPKVKGRLNRQRDMLIRALGMYGASKNNEIVIVFDGGLVKNAQREVKRDVIVIFAGRGKNADDYIVEYASLHRGKEILLVSNDNELKSRTRKYNVDFLSVQEFETILEDTVILEALPSNDEGLVKYNDDNEALDILMEQAPMEDYNDDAPRDKRKRKSYTKSKSEKKIERKVKKL